MPSRHSHHVAPIADATAPTITILCVGVLCLFAMDSLGLNVGVCVAAAWNVVWGFFWRALVLGVLGGLVAAVVAHWEA